MLVSTLLLLCSGPDAHQLHCALSCIQVASGRRKAVCPYYAARAAAAEADLLLVPYGSLLTQVVGMTTP